MNIVVAFTLEAFLLEYESQKTDLETRVERRIRELGLESNKKENMIVFDKDDNFVDNGVKFKLGYWEPWLCNLKNQYISVRGMTGIDDLLERMFIAESTNSSENRKK